ncbi:sulfotransferase [Aliidongia dinghuensis]|uniref:Sulfotransferase n=1 Tax=Aliidongia dinghuensis TaxID=1867774 RepID=A0A8J2YQ23_9PROT|nr:sulfotransferase domain-containing protein [Aliidongia dinghuensis]GGF06730.1 sulfotransferase [Aliidongia dinghuensis]
MSGLILLASYPKSGNTWMRLVLETLRREGQRPALDALGIESAAARLRYDQALDIETSDLSPLEIARARPWVSAQCRAAADGRILKMHDANLTPPGAAGPPFDPGAVDRVLYIVRDPRDVALSFARHFGFSLDQAVASLADTAFWMGRSETGLNPNLEQFLSSWSRHVESWLDAPGLTILCLRYEDLLQAPLESFAAAARFFGLPADADLLGRAVDACAFAALAAEERALGFRERHWDAAAPFFYRGRAGAWREGLPAALVEAIGRDHGPVMRRLGYEA